MRDRFANGLGDGQAVALAAAPGLDKVSHVAFGFDDDARHDRDRFVGIFSAGGFGREHYGVGAVEDGIGHVAGFGAGGARVFDHRLEHLRRRDDGLAPGAGTADHVLLNDRDFFWGDFDAEIAAGDHDSVGGFEDLFQMIYSLGLFELGDNGDVAAVGGNDVLDHADVGCGPNEGESNGVHTMVDSEFQVFAVFFRERGDGERNAGKVDAFLLAQHAAIEDVTQHVFAADSANTEFDQAVAEQDAGARREFTGKIGECSSDTSGCAGDVLRSDGHDGAGLQKDRRVAFKQPGTDFRALQILENADSAALAIGGAAQASYVAGVVLVRAMGKVEARDVHPEAKQVAHGGFGVARRADGADDFGPPGCRPGGQSLG